MKRINVLLVLFMLLLAVCDTAYALRCGNSLIAVGDLKNEVRLKCGEPYSRDVIGYIDHVESEKRIRVMVIEEWIVEVPSGNTIVYYSLVFEGNTLKEIRQAGEKKNK